MSQQSDLDDHADQLNPNNDAYWESRGYEERPDDWDEKVSEEDSGENRGAESPQTKQVG